MSDVTLEKVFSDAKALSPDEQRQLRELLAEQEAKAQQAAERPQIKRTDNYTDRSPEMRWLSEHREEYGGQLVALDIGPSIAML